MGVGPILSLAATGLSVGGSIMGGMSAAQGDEYEAQQAENAAEIGKTQAADTSAEMTANLTNAVQRIRATQASANVEGTSPSVEAITNNYQARGQQQIGIKVGNIMDQVAQDQSAAALYASNASDAILGGFLGGFGGLATGLAGAYKAAGSPSFGSMIGMPATGLFPGGI